MTAGTIRGQAWLRREPWLVAVFAVGLVLRAVLIPVTHGDDFIVWDKASAATLRGVDVYAHHPDYPHGPFAYFPLFLYLELPFRWLAQHSALPFTVLGKLPILAADVACAALIATELRRRGHGGRAVALGAALYFLNPLVLYNSAWYGRFDALGCALLLVAVRVLSREPAATRGAVWWGLAIAAKTFPGFIAAGVLRRAGAGRWRVLGVSVGVVLVLSLPYLGSPGALAHDLVLRDAGRTPTGLSWQHLLLHLGSEQTAKIISYALLLAFAVGTVWLTRVEDLWRYTPLVLVLFLLTSKLLLEQYLTWPLPFLVLLGMGPASRLRTASLALVGAFTVIGMLDTESWHPFGRSPDALNVLLALACAAYLRIGLTAAGRRQPAERVPA